MKPLRQNLLFRFWALISVLWLLASAGNIIDHWSGERVSSREYLLFNEKPASWGEQHPECRERYGLWPDGTKMEARILDDKYGDFIRGIPDDQIRSREGQEGIVRNNWARDVRDKIASCEEVQWMPIVKASAIANERSRLVANALSFPIVLLLSCATAFWIWAIVGKPYWQRAKMHWMKLPKHTRKGLTRLYLVVAVPWVVWHGYQIFDYIQLHHYWRWRDISHTFWSLLLVPIGGPILLLVSMWVATGFRKPAPDSQDAGAAQSDSGSPQSDTNSKRAPNSEPTASDRISPEVQAIFKKLDYLMLDEKAQVDGLPEPFRTRVISGADCDEIDGAVGEFGRDPRNPIPVNGPLGELIYLSNLRTPTAQQVIFHRLGSVRNIDAYETVSLDGAIWDVLFLHLYHPRKSRRAPAGYQIAASDERQRHLLGANEFVATFPERLPDAIANTNERLLGLRIRPPVREFIERFNFKRPSAHAERLKFIMTLLQSKASSS